MNKNLPALYQELVAVHFTAHQWLRLTLLVCLIQSHRWVRLEDLANCLPQTIRFESRRRGIQRLLDLPQLTFETLWFPLFSWWLSQEFSTGETLYIAIDRTRWRTVNLLVISLMYRGRGLPIYITWLDKKGNSNLSEQQEALSKALSLFTDYRVVVLGDREFCSVQLAEWLRQRKQTYFCLRLKKNTYIEQKASLWESLQNLGAVPGVSLYLKGVKVTKTRGFKLGNVAVKWKRQYRGWTAEEAWFILTNLPTLGDALKAYEKRMGIEEMFRDFKKGGYNLEDTQVKGKRLVALTLLISLAYMEDTLTGFKIRQKRSNAYVARPSEKGRKYKRHSHFYTGNRAQTWLHSLEVFAEAAQEFIRLCPQKRVNYLSGQRAVTLIQSSL